MKANEYKGAGRDKGFILVVVIWVVGLLAVIAATYAYSVRTHVSIHGNIATSVRAQFLADAGTMLAVRDLLLHAKNPNHSRRFPVDGQIVSCAIAGSGRVTIEVRDEAAKVDLNKAGVPLIESLVLGLGEPPEVASAIAASILDYRDRDDVRQLSGAEYADYIAAGLKLGPKNAPFEAVVELAQVFGMSAALNAKMRAHVTVYSGIAGIDARVASDELIATIRRGMAGSNVSFAAFPEPSQDHSLPAMFTVASRQRTFGIRVIAVTSSGARFIRRAVVDLGPRRVPRYTFRVWRRGMFAGGHGHENAAGAGLPPC